MKCRHCTLEIDEDSRFCPFCGKPQELSAGNMPPVSAADSGAGTVIPPVTSEGDLSGTVSLQKPVSSTDNDTTPVYSELSGSPESAEIPEGSGNTDELKEKIQQPAVRDEQTAPDTFGTGSAASGTENSIMPVNQDFSAGSPDSLTESPSGYSGSVNDPDARTAENQEKNAAEPAKEKEQVYFGKGALAVCLVIICLLSASTGAFAFLFFSLLDTLRG